MTRPGKIAFTKEDIPIQADAIEYRYTREFPADRCHHLQVWYYKGTLTHGTRHFSAYGASMNEVYDAVAKKMTEKLLVQPQVDV